MLFSLLQVRNDSCTVHEDFQATISECYDSYASSIEDHASFGPYADSDLTG